MNEDGHDDFYLLHRKRALMLKFEEPCDMRDCLSEIGQRSHTILNKVPALLALSELPDEPESQ